MRRFFSLGVAAVVVMVIFLLGTFSAGGPPKEGQQAATPAPRRPAVTFLSLLGFRELRTEDVQKELELTDEQKQKVKEIGRKYYEVARRDWAGFGGMSPQERKKKYAEIRQKSLERIKDIRKQVEEVLSADQLERLKQINLRTRVLGNPRILDPLGLSQSQQKRLRQIREQMQQRIRKLQQETLEKTLEVLTPEQRKKLEELATEGFAVTALGKPQARGRRTGEADEGGSRKHRVRQPLPAPLGCKSRFVVFQAAAAW